MIPTIDPQVKHVGVSYLRKLNANNLRELPGAIVVCENSEPLAVIVSVETYFRLQQRQAQELQGKLASFDERRSEVQARISQGARRQPHREKGDGKR